MSPSFPPRDDRSSLAEVEPIDQIRAVPADVTGGFSPKAAIAEGTGHFPLSETPSAVRARLRELPMIYILLLGMALLWTYTVLGDGDPLLYVFNAIVILALGGTVVLLSSRCPISLARLKGLELGVIGMVASLVGFGQYRQMLVYSMGEDVMMAQLTMKNVVLLTSVLVLTYGLYVPKSWRRAALVVVPLALLPFATLAVLFLRHPEAMDWLGEGWKWRPEWLGLAVTHQRTLSDWQKCVGEPRKHGVQAQVSCRARGLIWEIGVKTSDESELDNKGMDLIQEGYEPSEEADDAL